MAQLQDNEQVALTVEATDSQGNPVPDTGTRTWTTSDDTIVQLVDDGAGGVEAVTVGPIGSVVVTVQDQEPSPDGGVTPGQLFQGSVALDVVAGAVAQISIQVGTPTPRP